jgi:ribosomal protein S18 acetylase RimI-like enzyme
LVRLVAEVEGEAIANGQLSLVGPSVQRGSVVQALGRRAEIGSLVVAPGHRRRGIGRALLRALVGAADARGAPEVEIWVDAQARWVRAWYEREGFAPAGERVLPGPERVVVLRRPAGGGDVWDAVRDQAERAGRSTGDV